MAEVLEVERKIEWPIEENEMTFIDGVVQLIDEDGKEYNLPFRAWDKGGKRNDKPYIWKWENPEDPIGDASLEGMITLENGEKGKVKGGSWVSNKAKV